MSDEAVLRIVLDDVGGSGGATANRPAPTPSAPTGSPRSTGGASTGSGTGTAGAPPPPSKTNPLPVTVVTAPPPPPPPAAPPAPPSSATQPPDWLKSLINPGDPLKGVNPHVLMEGETGSGKSLAARHVAFERMKQGQDVHVLDPHDPQKWGGAKQVFQGQSAASDMAKFMTDTLLGRIKEKIAAEAKGGTVDFKPITIVLSDFARLIRESPQLQAALKDVLQEGRKYRIAVLADAANLRAADVGGGINAIRRNIGQQAQFFPPTATEGRQVDIAGVTHDVPDLPDYKEKIDPSLIKPEAGGYQPPVGAEAIARRQMEAEKLDKEVWQQRMKLDPEFRRGEQERYARSLPKAIPPEPPFDPAAQAKSHMEAEDRAEKVRQARMGMDPAYKRREEAKIPYAKVAPEPEKPRGVIRTALDIAESFRGTIGGVFGKLAGGALDITSSIRKHREEAAKAKEDGEGPRGPSALVTGAGIAAITIGTAISAIQSLTKAINDRVDKYAEYNPAVAQAQAMAEVKGIMNDMRRAQEYGPKMVEFIKAQSEMQQEYEEIKVKILMKIVPILTSIMKAVGGLLGLANDKDKKVEYLDPTELILNPRDVASAREGATIPMQADIIG